jgi:ribosome maturation factor RimP
MTVTLDQLGTQVIGFPVDMVSDARLVLTDELVREALRRAKQIAKSATETQSQQDE